MDADVTALLVRWREGDKAALDALIPVVYEDLRRIARARLRHEPGAHSIQTTALVHEVYLRLIDRNRVSLENRTHFLALTARLMRQILVDHARRRRAAKRGGSDTMMTLADVAPGLAPNIVDVIALDAALEGLARVEERLSRVVELKFFAGFTIDEMAAALDVSPATIERDWTIAKAWLYQHLSGRS
jgi:RNA polymerase sigma factor (TIGR02999 family)